MRVHFDLLSGFICIYILESSLASLVDSTHTREPMTVTCDAPTGFTPIVPVPSGDAVVMVSAACR